MIQLHLLVCISGAPHGSGHNFQKAMWGMLLDYGWTEWPLTVGAGSLGRRRRRWFSELARRASTLGASLTYRRLQRPRAPSVPSIAAGIVSIHVSQF